MVIYGEVDQQWEGRWDAWELCDVLIEGMRKFAGEIRVDFCDEAFCEGGGIYESWNAC
jgi:hypothetical protein